MGLLAITLAIAVAPSVIDSIFRLLLTAASWRRSEEAGTVSAGSWVVVVPARAEGLHVEKTLASINAARGSLPVKTILLLDGADSQAARIGTERDAVVLVKEPPGPTKGAALGWLAKTSPDLLQDADALLLLDVGSMLSPQFFDAFFWPDGADAVQSVLHGSGSGVGEVVAHSEAVAQSREDVGRQRLGWNVRLRGTGTAFRPNTFLAMTPRLVTQVEDTELTLRLAAEGRRCALSESEAFVVDDKPGDARIAAAQRSRWLAGRVELLLRAGTQFVRLIWRRPFEGISFVAEMLGRPLSLTVPLRMVAGAILVAIWLSRSTTWAVVAGIVALLSGVSDLVLHAGAGVRTAWPSLAGAWVVAVVFAPRAFLRWVRTKRS